MDKKSDDQEAQTQRPEERSFQPRKEAKIFRYKTPLISGTKGKTLLCRSDIMDAGIQAIKKGGENNLHSHAAMDGFWFVLKGRARFYGEEDALLADLGPLEGIFIPRGCAYWFESASEELLELLQVEAIDKSVKNIRINHTEQKKGPAERFFPKGA